VNILNINEGIQGKAMN